MTRPPPRSTRSDTRFPYTPLFRSPQEPAYADGEDPAARNLERLFVILQRESTPRAFYFARNGQRRYVDHRYFFGKLRAAHVAKGDTIRNALFGPVRSEEHTSELQSLMRISYAVFCLKKKNNYSSNNAYNNI